jgi:hypothetical protein
VVSAKKLRQSVHRKAVDPMSNDVNPYQSPNFVPPQVHAAWSAAARRRVVPFASAHGLAVFAMIMIGIVCLASLALLISCFLQIELIDKARHGHRITQQEAFANDARHALFVFVRALAYIVSGIVFLIWFYKVYRNLPSLGAAQTEHSPGWAVGWWFIPIAGLIVPCQIAKEIWKGSHPDNLAVRSKAALVGSPLVTAWWTFWLIMIVIGTYSAFSRPNMKSLDQIVAANWAGIFAMAATLPAGVLAVLFVAKVDSNQTRRYERCLRQEAGDEQADFDDAPVRTGPSVGNDGASFAPPASRPPMATGGGENIDDWLGKL